MSKRRVADFPAEYFDIWRLAVAGQLDLKFPSKGHATNKKVDLQIFRKRLAEESPELAHEFFQADLLVTGGEDFGYLTGYIPDWKRQVRDKIAASDLSSSAVVAIGTEVLETKQAESKDAMSDILKSLDYKPPAT